MASGKEVDGKRETLSFSALLGSISSNKDTWLIDSGASKLMIGYKRVPTDLGLLLFLKFISCYMEHIILESNDDIKKAGGSWSKSRKVQ